MDQGRASGQSWPGALLLSLLSCLFFLPPLSSDAALAARKSSCEGCHAGIEAISDVEAMAGLSCTFCHRGRPDAGTEEEAHRGLWRNPSDLRVIGQTCGQCHQERVYEIERSLHATSAGIISAARYTWAAQKGRQAIFSNYEVSDSSGKVFRQLPVYDPSSPQGPENHPVDDYLREECLRCHVWSRGEERDGDFRASGCAACHVIYSDDGLYLGGDRAVPRKKKGYPVRHEITRKIPPFQCIHCHNRGGRTGVSFIGDMESAGYGSPWADAPGKKGGRKLHGKYYDHLQPDIHFERGLACIDCHGSRDVHGDGRLRDKKEQAVAIECTDCHGTQEHASSLEDSAGMRLDNLERDRDGNVILTSKLDGRKHLVPQVIDLWDSKKEMARIAMFIPAHAARLECYACHSRWAPQCYGCHVQQDLTSKGLDWLRYKGSSDPSMAASKENREGGVWRWRETRSYLRWESPALGINSEGKVAPFIPGCQVIFTQIGKDGRAVVRNRVFTTSHGTSGIASNPIQPHTVSRKARSCEDCHSNPKAMGLGGGIYRPGDNGLPVGFELERIVDSQGHQLQATSHEGARPFNAKELDGMARVNVCASCHGWMLDPEFWQGLYSWSGEARGQKAHDRLLEGLLGRKKGAAP